MKVCTDACVFGAHVADMIVQEQMTIHHALDIGTGTGLLSLLLAQKTNAVIDALEIDKKACEQARQNFGSSPWEERLNVVHEDVLQFQPVKKYDLIITNPPFYENSLRSVNENKNAAKHDTALTLERLLKVMEKSLSNYGIIAVLLPFYRLEYFEKEAARNNLFLFNKLLLKHKANSSFFRGILLFKRERISFFPGELIIKNEDHSYTDQFTELLKDYYLYL